VSLGGIKGLGGCCRRRKTVHRALVTVAPNRANQARSTVKLPKDAVCDMSQVGEGTRPEGLKILVADDEANIRRILETRLSMQGHEVLAASNGAEALELFRGSEPDLVVLDVMMPELDGFAVVERIRAQSEVPIILLTALGDVADRITGLQLGADDYMVKPFSPKELEARIRCVMRRATTAQGGHGSAGGSGANVVVVGDLSVDFNRRQAFRADERIRLTGMEFNLLELLISRSGEPISRLDMLEKVWGYKPERSSDSRVVDVHISRLRAKLEHDPENPELILTARGMGYMFQRIAQVVKVG
jgi:OmpR family response regulator RpaB